MFAERKNEKRMLFTFAKHFHFFVVAKRKQIEKNQKLFVFQIVKMKKECFLLLRCTFTFFVVCMFVKSNKLTKCFFSNRQNEKEIAFYFCEAFSLFCCFHVLQKEIKLDKNLKCCFVLHIVLMKKDCFELLQNIFTFFVVFHVCTKKQKKTNQKMFFLK